jgi:hypothetical protein
MELADLNRIQLDDAARRSLARLVQHCHNRYVGIITASRGKLDQSANRARNRELKTLINQIGFGYVNIVGEYIENYGTPEAYTVSEEAFMLFGSNRDDGGRMLGFLKKAGERFDQDSVLYKPFDSEQAYLIGTNHSSDYPGYGNKVDAGEFRPNRVGMFYSLLTRGGGKPGLTPAAQKTFTFEGTDQTDQWGGRWKGIGFYKDPTFLNRGRLV